MRGHQRKALTRDIQKIGRMPAMPAVPDPEAAPAKPADPGLGRPVVDLHSAAAMAHEADLAAVPDAVPRVASNRLLAALAGLKGVDPHVLAEAAGTARGLMAVYLTGQRRFDNLMDEARVMAAGTIVGLANGLPQLRRDIVHFLAIKGWLSRTQNASLRQLKVVAQLIPESKLVKFRMTGLSRKSLLWDYYAIGNERVRIVLRSFRFGVRIDPSMIPGCQWARGSVKTSTVRVTPELSQQILNDDLAPSEFDEVFRGSTVSWGHLQLLARAHGITKEDLQSCIESFSREREQGQHAQPSAQLHVAGQRAR